MDKPGQGTEPAATRPSVPTSAKSPTTQTETLNFLQLVSISMLGSLLISYYVLTIGALNKNKIKVDAAAQAAAYAANELSNVYVESSIFGRVGLCDKELDDTGDFNYAQHKRSIIAIDSIRQTLQIDQKLAERLKRPLMVKFIEKDRLAADKVELDLRQKLLAAAEPDLLAGASNVVTPQVASLSTANHIYQNVMRAFSSDRSLRSFALTDVHIRLGRVDGKPRRKRIPEGDCATIVDEASFSTTDQKHAPNAVLVEGVFQSRERNNAQILRKSSCALITSAPYISHPSTLVINFPDGKPSVFDSGLELLNYGRWKNPGVWQQAVGSEVPGRGSLAPSLQPVLPEMNASDAFTIALYHWMRQLGPDVDGDKFMTLISQKWSTVPLIASGILNGGDSEPNSCLAIDTGAREYAILNKTAPGGAGQQALAKAFGITMPFSLMTSSIGEKFPPSAIPLFVDKKGNCLLPGRSDFSKELIFDFLANVYQTNLAAVESYSVANMVRVSTNASLGQLIQKIFIERQELESVLKRLERLESEIKGEDNRLIDLTKERVDLLKATIADDELERDSLRKTSDRAAIALANANRIAGDTYELCTHTFSLCKNGVYRVEKPFSGYLISRRYTFKPFTKSLSERDFVLEPKDKSSVSAWFSHKLEVVADLVTTTPPPDLTVEGMNWSEFTKLNLPHNDIVPVTIFLTNDNLSIHDKGRPSIKKLDSYPFGNIRLPSGQLLYYCQNALATGSNPPVSWSVLLRDLVATHSLTSLGKENGMPVASEKTDWCKSTAGGSERECPAMAAELQLRTPLPAIDQSTEGLYLTSPANNSQVPEIPPVPADLL